MSLAPSFGTHHRAPCRRTWLYVLAGAVVLAPAAALAGKSIDSTPRGKPIAPVAIELVPQGPAVPGQPREFEVRVQASKAVTELSIGARADRGQVLRHAPAVGVRPGAEEVSWSEVVTLVPDPGGAPPKLTIVVNARVGDRAVTRIHLLSSAEDPAAGPLAGGALRRDSQGRAIVALPVQER